MRCGAGYGGDGLVVLAAGLIRACLGMGCLARKRVVQVSRGNCILILLHFTDYLSYHDCIFTVTLADPVSVEAVSIEMVPHHSLITYPP